MLKDEMNVCLGGRVVIFSCSSGQFIFMPLGLQGGDLPILKDEIHLLECPLG